MSALDDLIDMVEDLEMEVQPARDELRKLRAELEGAKNGKQHADDEMKSMLEKLTRLEGENAGLRAKVERLELDNEACKKAMRPDALWTYQNLVRAESETRWANHYARRAQEFRDAVGPLLAYRDANTLNFQLEKLDDFLRALRLLMEKQP